MQHISQSRQYITKGEHQDSQGYAFYNAKYVVVDCETTGLNPRTDQIVGVALAASERVGVYYSFNNEWKEQNVATIKVVLENPNVAKIFHNAVFDLSMLKMAGFQVNGPVHDTMLLAHLHDPDRKEKGLKELSKQLLGQDSTLKDAELQHWLYQNKLKKKDLSKAPSQLLAEYACEDVMNTYALFLLFSKKFKETSAWLQQRGFKKTPIDYYKEEVQPIIPVVVDMQLRGAKLDLEQTALRKTQLQRRITEIETELKGLCAPLLQQAEEIIYAEEVAKRKKRNKTGKLKKQPPPIPFNWESLEHVKTLIIGVLKEPVLEKTDSGEPSLDIEVLEKYAERHDWLKLYIEYKELRKLVSTYLDGLLKKQESGAIHASFNLAGTATGRFSSSKPNLQNLPKHGDIKKLFIPRAGHKFIYGDYSQLELRLAAHLSQDPLLLAAYQQGLDLHKETAATIYGVPVLEIEDADPRRDVGKRVNFAIIYNASGWRIAEILGLMSGLGLEDWNGKRRAAQQGDEIIKKLFGKYKGLKAYVDKQLAKMLQYNCAVSEFGYCRRLPGLRSQDRKEYRHSLKAGFNLPIQGLGASVCKRAMVELHRQGFQLINQIHDAIIIEVEEDAIDQGVCAQVKNIMETVTVFSVPLVVEPKILTSFAEK